MEVGSQAQLTQATNVFLCRLQRAGTGLLIGQRDDGGAENESGNGFSVVKDDEVGDKTKQRHNFFLSGF